MRYVALNVHQRYCEGTELAGEKLRRFRFPNTHRDWARLASELTPDTRVVLEATGNAYWVYDIISQCAGEVLLANPLKTRPIAEARIKTDKVDAEILVRLLPPISYRRCGSRTVSSANSGSCSDTAPGW